MKHSNDLKEMGIFFVVAVVLQLGLLALVIWIGATIIKSIFF